MFDGLMRKMFKARDDKPVMVSFILQRDDCSRLLGEFNDKYLPDCAALALVWKSSSGAINAMHSASVEPAEASRMMIKGTVLIEANSRGT